MLLVEHAALVQLPGQPWHRRKRKTGEKKLWDDIKKGWRTEDEKLRQGWDGDTQSKPEGNQICKDLKTRQNAHTHTQRVSLYCWLISSWPSLSGIRMPLRVPKEISPTHVSKWAAGFLDQGWSKPFLNVVSFCSINPAPFPKICNLWSFALIVKK